MQCEHEGEIKYGETKREKLKHNHLRCFWDDGKMMKERQRKSTDSTLSGSRAFESHEAGLCVCAKGCVHVRVCETMYNPPDFFCL